MATTDLIAIIVIGLIVMPMAVIFVLSRYE